MTARAAQYMLTLAQQGRTLLRALIAAFFCVCFSLRANSADTEDSPSNSSVALEVEDPSIMNVGAQLRDPFSPIGYVPPYRRNVQPDGEPTVPSSAQWRKALSKLRYGGSIKRYDVIFAIVNGSLVKEGDFVAVTIDGALFRFKVFEVTMKGVRFKPAD